MTVSGRPGLRMLLVLVVASATILAFTAAAAAELEPGGTFMDDDETVHEGGIEAIAAEGLTVGCNPPHGDRFCPDERLTRAQMATMIVRALDLPAAGTNHFTDDDGHILEGAIDRLAEAGITQGCNPPANDQFCPNRGLSRAEAAAFISRAQRLPASSTDHFIDDDGMTLEGAINRLAEAGVTQGCNPPANDRFCPERQLTRAEMATLLTRALGLTSLKPPGRQVVFTPDIGINGNVDLQTGEPTFHERYRLWDRSLGCGFDEDRRACTIDISSNNAEVWVKHPNGSEEEVASNNLYYPIRFIPSSPGGVYEFTFNLDDGTVYRGMIDFLETREVEFVNTGLSRVGESGETLDAYRLGSLDLNDATTAFHNPPDNALEGVIPGESPKVDQYFWLDVHGLKQGVHTFFAKVDGRWYLARATFP